MLGISFKPHSDDLRESPAVELAEQLFGKGIDLRIYDPDLSLNKLYGSNKAYIEKTLPHIASLLAPSLTDILKHAELLLITKPLSVAERDQLSHLEKPDQILVDLTHQNPQKVTRLVENSVA